ncbi:hypothetical protein LBMAG56_53640 [Verrucomicrobiota bacterium]|nr:hypothetical protein LBMAG56_53640 [Verrucomicrobiota bacterium]
MKPLILNYRLSPTDTLPLDETFAVGFPGCEDRLRVTIGQRSVPDGHARWMWEQIQTHAAEPVLIFVDGDVLFADAVVDIEMPEWAMMMGMWEPRHCNPVTKVFHHARLHTCLLWVRPGALLAATTALNVGWKNMPLRPVNPFEQTMVPPASDDGYDMPHLYDTAAAACHWWPRRMVRLSEELLERFTHLHCGEWAEVAERNGLPGLCAVHQRLRAGTMSPATWRNECWQFYRTRSYQSNSARQ